MPFGSYAASWLWKIEGTNRTRRGSLRGRLRLKFSYLMPILFAEMRKGIGNGEYFGIISIVAKRYIN